MHKLDDFIGQSALKELIRPKLEPARSSGIALPHLLLCGEKESGKSTFAVAVAEELGVSFTSISARDLKKTLDLTGFCRMYAPRVLQPQQHSFLCQVSPLLRPKQNSSASLGMTLHRVCGFIRLFLHASRAAQIIIRIARSHGISVTFRRASGSILRLREVALTEGIRPFQI